MSGLALAPRTGLRGGGTTMLAVLAATVAAWVVLSGRMAGMDMGPGGDPGTLGWFTLTWAVMTAAMMLPAVSPAVLRLARARHASGLPAVTLLFLLGYGLIWMCAGLVGFAVVQAVRGLHIGALAFERDGRWLTGAGILAAAVYQLTPAKRRRLTRCLQPVLPPPSAQARVALSAGLRHGRCCVACCWTLMAALYALGMMSLAWMALLTVLIACERVLPRPVPSVRVVAVVLALLGAGVAVAPADIPVLTVPHAAGMSAMAPSTSMTPGSSKGPSKAMRHDSIP